MSPFPLASSGLWREARSGRPAGPAPALFVDRDGTLIRLVNYLCRADEVVPILKRRGRFRTEYAGATLRDHYGLQRPAA